MEDGLLEPDDEDRAFQPAPKRGEKKGKKGRKAELAVEEAPAPAAEEELVALDDTDQPYQASATRSRVTGDGIVEATVRQPAYFVIEAMDSRGRRRHDGGDAFFVAIRGPSQTRAKVADNCDGTYLVVWKPHVSGTYTIAVSLLGVLLPGAPFTVHTSTCLPCASKCGARGEALYSATSRITQTFEMLFRDRLGQIARAVDLDIFVEPVSSDSPRNRREKEVTVTPDARAESGTKGIATSFSKKGGRKPSIAGQHKGRTQSEHGSRDEASFTKQHVMETALSECATPGGLDEYEPIDGMSRHRNIRVKVGEKPLIVRSGFDKGSEQVRTIRPSLALHPALHATLLTRVSFLAGSLACCCLVKL